MMAMPDGGASLGRTGDLTPDEYKLLMAYRQLSQVQRERLLHVIAGMPDKPISLPQAGSSTERATALQALAEVREKRMLALGLKRDPSQPLRVASGAIVITIFDKENTEDT